jgi:hypothetical protein
MAQINLLPEELKPKKYVLKASKTLNKVATGFMVLFLIVATLAIGGYLVLSSRVTSVKNNHDKLTTQVKALNESEQRMVLIKDRVDKINKVIAKESTNEELDIMDKVILLAGGDMSIDEVNVDLDKIDFIVSANASSQMTKFLAGLISEEDYKSMDLLSLKYAPELGYKLNLKVVSK